MKEPLYKRIARELSQNITLGQYPTGSLIPSELELCELYQVSRHTVREALRDLTEAGLLSRRKGVGSVVVDNDEKRERNHPLASLEDLFVLAKTNLRVVKKIDEVVADVELAKIIGGKPGDRWLHIASIREDSQKKDSPICWTDSYVSPDYAKVKSLVRSDPFALISDLIEKHYGVQGEEVRQTISAVGVPVKIAKTLGVDVGYPALKIVRHYLDRSGNVFETTVSIHPADRYTCSITLKRQTGNRT
ncbi:GntR-family transcriptional regulator [Pectobacterium atrosepticum SCRI1043]|uniref:GntR-family transcriptional regulator n=1 Tax=Pectobacterium atrosepticum (strain SCRI 1043 / ATCC BAA-672) TaxID=218491 RepID=Q6D3A3_PECAS|nr:GntR family transcriptional regulator [Pectobacterium atrosepticum]MCL6315174.1 GntR family transcriptional regulator [Pectobacterium atrosepticum]MCL6320590.1 GntR family transcriptional regulator [Pectobacterium atrosepticum]CAG75741.1 GntR-family transcriptional regulator [Pectobacterium atrosepticum SCRI1043]